MLPVSRTRYTGHSTAVTALAVVGNPPPDCGDPGHGAGPGVGRPEPAGQVRPCTELRCADLVVFREQCRAISGLVIIVQNTVLTFVSQVEQLHLQAMSHNTSPCTLLFCRSLCWSSPAWRSSGAACSSARRPGTRTSWAGSCGAGPSPTRPPPPYRYSQCWELQ